MSAAAPVVGTVPSSVSDPSSAILNRETLPALIGGWFAMNAYLPFFVTTSQHVASSPASSLSIGVSVVPERLYDEPEPGLKSGGGPPLATIRWLFLPHARPNGMNEFDAF